MMRASYLLSNGALIALIALCVSWELVVAPLRPGGSWLVLKVIPLMFCLRGLLHARRYTFQWSSLLACLYLFEGLTRAVTDATPSRWMALIEIIASVAWIVGNALFLRSTRPPSPPPVHPPVRSTSP